MSWYSWKSPRLHGQTVKRITAGQEKFARRYGRNPCQVSINLSLFESFQQRGNGTKAGLHLDRAMAESRAKVLLEPYNAGSFYWYGKALLTQGDIGAAQEQFAQAVTLEPASKKYLKAYRKSQQGSEKS